MKLDISKAYDRVWWSYLWHRLRTVGFKKWVRWIKFYVTSVKYMVCMNGPYVKPINPSMGLRQGDPHSPYLFMLCFEGLSHSLNLTATNGGIHGCCISTSTSEITQLLFVDDSFFFKANSEESHDVKYILNEYEHQSGQAVNFNKSRIFFSCNVWRDKQYEISNIPGVHNELKDSKYLGLPSLIGRSNKKVFIFVKKRVWKKLGVTVNCRVLARL